MQTVMYLFYLLINKMNSYLLRAAQHISLLKISFGKYKSLGWLSEFYTTLLYEFDIDANSFAYFQLGASNSEKDKYLKKRKKTLFETNMKLCNKKFENIKI